MTSGAEIIQRGGYQGTFTAITHADRMESVAKSHWTNSPCTLDWGSKRVVGKIIGNFKFLGYKSFDIPNFEIDIQSTGESKRVIRTAMDERRVAVHETLKDADTHADKWNGLDPKERQLERDRAFLNQFAVWTN